MIINSLPYLPMKKIKLLTAVFAVALSLIMGCKKESTKENLDANGSLSKAQSSTATQLSPAGQQKLKSLLAAMPARLKDKLKQNSKLVLQTHPEYLEYVRKAIDPSAVTCNDNTLTNQWLDGQLSDWNREIIDVVLGTEMLDLPTYDALVFENSSANQTFGVNGEYTQRLTKTFKDLKRFWNIQSDQIVLAAMHGSMLADRNKVIRTYEAVYGLDPADAAYYADIVTTAVQVYPQLRGGNHPIFTFNAFAQQGFEFPPYGVIPDKIIMGDGIMEAFTAIGFGDVAPQAILAHEYGHHIQFQLNLFTGSNTPEATRRTELMADAYSAYYLSHARGASMQWKRVQQFLAVFFNIGDCSFTSSGHHGTPTQRMAAALWGYSVADGAQKQGHILTAQEFTSRFEAQLPAILAN
ncbi:MAG: hypothetical protein JWQ28_652 [Pedobacter sp.]|nr:hypothetical protein [Pedobacter sp.]